MAELIFPSSPAAGDLFPDPALPGVSQWIWDGSRWNLVQGGASVTVSNTPPGNPNNGDLWFDAENLKLFVWYDDGATAQWVVANPSGGGGASRATPLSFCFPGKPAASGKLAVVIPWAATIAANFASSVTYVDTTATAVAPFAIWKITGGTTKTQIGTISIQVGSNTSVTMTSSAATLATGDVLQIIAPATQDATLADVSLTIYVVPS